MDFHNPFTATATDPQTKDAHDDNTKRPAFIILPKKT
jgi:hypothetical protein